MREKLPAPAGAYVRGQVISAWRSGAGLSREALAQRLGVSERAIQYYENGKRHCSDVLVCLRLSRLMRVDIYHLLGITTGAPSTQAATTPIGESQKRGGAPGVII